MSDFPVDDATLVMLSAACEINPDNGQTNLMAFLDMGTRVKREVLIEEGNGPPVYEVEYEDGYEPFSPQQVIRSLVAEIQGLRAGDANSHAEDPSGQ